MSRLQFIHRDCASSGKTRQDAIEYIKRLTNTSWRTDMRFDESLIGEPIAVTYLDDEGHVQVMFGIGTEGEPGDGKLKDYHIIDSAKLVEDISKLGGDTSDLTTALLNEISRAQDAEANLQRELNVTQTAAGLSADGSYVKNTSANYIANENSLNEADVKLDAELARVEKARKDITGQDTDEYVKNLSLIDRPLKYIADAESLNDADIRLDTGLQKLDGESVKGVIVNDVEATVHENIAEVTIKANDISIGKYEDYDGLATKPHPIHNNYSVLDAIKQLDWNFLDFSEKEELARKGIHVVKITSGLDTNVKEAYDLVDANGNVVENSQRIVIYKDSSLHKAYLGHMDDNLDDHTLPDVTPGVGDTALCFIYQRMDGTYDLVKINVESYLHENEFKDGLKVNNHEVSVKIDPSSDSYLSISENGIKVAGVESAIANAKQEEENRARAQELALKEKLDNVQVAAGLNPDGTYTPNGVATFIDDAVSLKNADEKLDNALKNLYGGSTVEGYDTIHAIGHSCVAEATARELADNGLSADITAESERAQRSEDSLATAISGENTRAERIEGELRNDLDDEIARAQDAEETEARIRENAVNALTTRVAANETALSNEITRATQKETQLSADTTAEQTRATIAELGIRNDLTTETTRATGAEAELRADLNREADRANNAETTLGDAIDAETARAQAEEARIETLVNGVGQDEKDRAEAAEQELRESINNEISRAQTKESSLDADIADINDKIDIIDGNDATSGSFRKEVKDAKAEILGGASSQYDTLKKIEDKVVANKVVAGDTSVVVTVDENTAVKVKLNETNNALKLTTDGLLSKLDLEYVGDEISLKANDVVIASISTTAFTQHTLIEEATLYTVTEQDSPVEAPYIKIVWKTEGVQDVTRIPLSGLIDVYEAGAGLQLNSNVFSVKIASASESFLSVDNNGLKVNGIANAISTAVSDEAATREAADTTLGNRIDAEATARANADDALSQSIDLVDGKVAKLNGAYNEDGSVKKSIMDATIGSVVTSISPAQAAEQSLIRVIDGTGKFYVSNSASDLKYGDTTVSGALDAIKLDATDSKQRISALEHNVSTAETRIAALESDLATASTKIAELEATIDTLVNGNVLNNKIKDVMLRLLEGWPQQIAIKKYDAHNEETTSVADTEKVKIKFADDAEFVSDIN